ncbi:hypothetical protein SDC9_19525 [bioreactor metagenome]|uniref:Uncharacterized protein n=1 Tax=bioreactor metagenome TaxID=1076179 RepID=A0A644U466_9ZZZZ
MRDDTGQHGEVGKGDGMGQGADRGLAIALGEQQEGQARALCGLGIDLAVADIERAAAAQHLMRLQERRGVGLARGQAVTADDRRKERRDLKMAQHGRGRGERLVGADRQRMAPVPETGQRLADARKECRQPHGALVAGGEGRGDPGLQQFVSARARSLEQALHQMRHAAADEAAHLHQGERGKAVLGQHLVRGGVDVGHGIDQRAVEVEDQGRQGHQASFHLIEQPIEATCPAGPCPVAAISSIAS